MDKGSGYRLELRLGIGFGFSVGVCVWVTRTRITCVRARVGVRARVQVSVRVREFGLRQGLGAAPSGHAARQKPSPVSIHALPLEKAQVKAKLGSALSALELRLRVGSGGHQPQLQLRQRIRVPVIGVKTIKIHRKSLQIILQCDWLLNAVAVCWIQSNCNIICSYLRQAKMVWTQIVAVTGVILQCALNELEPGMFCLRAHTYTSRLIGLEMRGDVPQGPSLLRTQTLVVSST